MRVLLVTAHFRPHVGGIERFVENLADGLATRGHEVTVVCCRTERGSAATEEGRYRVVRVPASTVLERRLGVPYPIPSPVVLRRLREEIGRADVVHVQDALYVTSVVALRGACQAEVPSLLTQHVGFVPQGRRALDLAERAAIVTLGRSARLATRVVSLNDDVARFARRAWKLPQVRVLPVGVPAPVGADRDEERRRLGIDPERFVALFVGRDVPKKGLDVVLGAADAAYEIVAVTDRNGPAPAGATLLPPMPHERLGRLYAAADAFVLPSEAEGVPVALQEAAWAGLPLVITLGPGYEGVVSADEVHAVDRDPESVRSALRELAADPARRDVLGARARALADRSFGLDSFLDAYELQYGELTLK